MEFTQELPQDSVVEDSHLSETVQAQFHGFTYGNSLSLLHMFSPLIVVPRQCNRQDLVERVFDRARVEIID